MSLSSEMLALPSELDTQPPASFEQNLATVKDMVGDLVSLDAEDSSDAVTASEAEITPDVLVQDFAPRVDRLIEQIGGTTAVIGDTKFHFTNGGHVVEVSKSYPYEENNTQYPVLEVVRATIPSNGEPAILMGEMHVMNPAFNATARGELSTPRTDLIVHMDTMLRTVEQHVQQNAQAA